MLLLTEYLFLNIPESPKGNLLFYSSLFSSLPAHLLSFCLSHSLSFCIRMALSSIYFYFYFSIHHHYIQEFIKSPRFFLFVAVEFCPTFAILSPISLVQIITLFLLKYYLSRLPANILAHS